MIYRDICFANSRSASNRILDTKMYIFKRSQRKMIKGLATEQAASTCLHLQYLKLTDINDDISGYVFCRLRTAGKQQLDTKMYIFKRSQPKMNKRLATAQTISTGLDLQCLKLSDANYDISGYVFCQFAACR